MRNKLAVAVVAILLGAAMAVTVDASTAAAAATCKGTAPSDFNGDGISDLAIGEPNVGTGDVHVLYGTRSGLHADASGTAPGDQLITNLLQTNSEKFGAAVVALDFNGDGCSDLAVGVPRSILPDIASPTGKRTDRANGVKPAAEGAPGYVAIYLGSPTGLSTSQDDINGLNAGVPTGTEDMFGTALAAGDLNNDGRDDLIVGAPMHTVTGAIYVFPGTTSPSITGHVFIPGDGTVPAGDGQADQFGSAIATGDFSGDGRDDVAVGAPHFGNRTGIVDVMNGSSTAPFLSTSGAAEWSQDTPGVSGTAEAGDTFGSSVATGDFRGDGHTDLAIGVPGEAIGDLQGAGMVNVIYSLNNGLTAAGNQGWSQDSSGVSGTSEAFDAFGSALAAGDFNGNGRDDLAVGVAGEAIGTPDGCGQVNVLMGSSGVGLSSAGQQAWNQNTSGIAGTAELGDNFGNSLTVLRTRSSSRDDLVVGVSGEGIGSIDAAGEIQLIPGSLSGLTATNSQVFSADTTGVKGVATMFGNFGFAVT